MQEPWADVVKSMVQALAKGDRNREGLFFTSIVFMLAIIIPVGVEPSAAVAIGVFAMVCFLFRRWQSERHELKMAEIKLKQIEKQKAPGFASKSSRRLRGRSGQGSPPPAPQGLPPATTPGLPPAMTQGLPPPATKELPPPSA